MKYLTEVDNQTLPSSDCCSDNDSKQVFTQSIDDLDGDRPEIRYLTEVDNQTLPSSNCCSNEDS